MNYLLYTKEELIDRLCYEFVSKAVTSDNINLVDKDKNSALRMAVKIHQWNLVEHLVERGADKDVLNRQGFAPVTSCTCHMTQINEPWTY